ncbi:MAG TPA: pyrroloquinoline quinone biosynthesis protein PqqB [Polyangiaceae bacterium]|nr:pyrroloquinoline quinone biosynthesis protein PqqB [Polyangiaceae bacterium]
MFVRVLGSSAGGGFPQWNCGCPNCTGVRAGTIRAKARTQESVAVSADGDSWFLLNASPEIRAQIEGFPRLHPRALRDTPLAGILFTSGDLDHCLGLLSLRESQRLDVYATAAMRRSFVEGNTLYPTLERFEGQVRWHPLAPNERCALLLSDGKESGLELVPYSVRGKPPLHAKQLAPSPGDNLGLRIEDRRTGGVLAYVSGVTGPSSELEACVAGANAIFFDGTFWTRDELVALGVSNRYAEDMAHWPLSGPDGSLAFLSRQPAARKLFIHINNTNPILREDSPERAEVMARGVEVSEDGQEFSL